MTQETLPASGDEKLHDAQSSELHERLEIAAHAAIVLVRLFDADHYLRHGKELPELASLDHGNKDAVFDHYLEHGIQRNASPSPYLDLGFVREELEKKLNRLLGDDESVVTIWLRHGLESIQGVPWFDAGFYLTEYTDLAGKVDNAFLHFATNGLLERRLPTAYLQLLTNQSLSYFPGDVVDINTLLSVVPSDFLQAFVSGAYAQEMESLFMGPLYLAQRDIEAEIPHYACLANFLVTGASDDIRPSVLFNAEFYLQNLNKHISGTADAVKVPVAARQYHGQRVPQGVARPIIPEEKAKFFGEKPADISLIPVDSSSAYLHWFLIGREFNVISSPLFDEEQYCLSHGDAVLSWNAFPFEHYLHHGISAPARRISAYFDAGFYHHQIQDLTENYPLLDYVLYGQETVSAPAPDLDCSKVHTPKPLLSSAAEQTAMFIGKQVDRLNTGVLADMLSRVEALDPTVATPLANRRLLMAPIKYAEAELNSALSGIIADLAKTQYDSIVLVPQVRMAGSAKIAGKFAEVLASITGTENVLVILTDQSTFERPEWFPENVDVLNLFGYVSREPMDRKVGALFDVVRGLEPRRLININSNVGWHMTSLFGRQLSAWMDLYIYLFCWDINEAGKKQGYPIEWFLPTFDYCKGVFCDSDDLREELWDRYCLTNAQRAKICTLHTPAENRDISYAEALKTRTVHQGVRRVFWSGRFDRQKRIDILLDVVNAMPDVEFWVWGKAVLNDEVVNFDELPDNVRLMGAYQRIDDVPIAACDCFLYTAGWDGLPTVLIEVGSRAVPVVASAVGGVTDLISPENGWPIADHENISDYVNAINEVLDDYPAAMEKAQALREHTLALCNVDSYRSALSQMIGLTEQEAAA